MKALLLSKDGDGLGVAQHMAYEGAEVYVYINNDKCDNALIGLVHRIKDWQSYLGRVDFIFTDTVEMPSFIEPVEASGTHFLGFNPSVWRVEMDRVKGMELFKCAGITTPETLSFPRPSACEVPDWEDGWVLKCCGNIGNDKTTLVTDKRLWKHSLAKLPADVPLICQRIVDGVEVSTEGWFNGERFVRPFNHTFEEKKFLTGNLGPTTGCEGNVVIQSESNHLTKATIERVEPFLKLLGYRGPFDVNCIVNESDAHALEVTGRLGFDAIEAFCEALEVPIADFFYSIASGTAKKVPVIDQPTIAVRLSTPPYPNRAPDTSSAGEPILGIDDAALPHLYLADVQKRTNYHTTAGATGILLKATALGSVKGNDYTSLARERVYRVLDKIKVPNKQYRTDIGSRVNRDIARLTDWGWL